MMSAPGSSKHSGSVRVLTLNLWAQNAAPEPVGRLLFTNHSPNYQLDFELERELQTVAAARFIEAFVEQWNLHVVVVGDLNATPEAASILFRCGHQSLEGMSVCTSNSGADGFSGYAFYAEIQNEIAWAHPKGKCSFTSAS